MTLQRGFRPAEVEREVMDIAQAAAFLGISRDTLYVYAQRGAIPAFRLGNRWRFRRGRLEEWMDEKSRELETGSSES